MPNLYLEDLYEDYKKDGDLEKTICQGAEMISRWMNKLNNVERANLFPFKENMISVLVNAELNRELLEGMPHRTFLDLAEIDVYKRQPLGYLKICSGTLNQQCCFQPPLL